MSFFVDGESVSVFRNFDSPVSFVAPSLLHQFHEDGAAVRVAFTVCHDFRSLTSDYSFIVNSHSSTGFVLGRDWHAYCAEVAKEQDVDMPLSELHAPSEWLYFSAASFAYFIDFSHWSE
jgi:hypothetical protein